MSHRGEARFLGGFHARHQFLARRAEHMVIDARLVAHLAAEKLIDGHAEMLARDVPQRDVDCAYARHNRRAAEVARTIHRLPVVFYQQRVLAHQIRRELQANGGFGGFQVSPRARLAIAGYAGVGMNFDEQVTVDGIGFYGCYFHGLSPRRYFVSHYHKERLACQTSLATSGTRTAMLDSAMMPSTT